MVNIRSHRWCLGGQWLKKKKKKSSKESYSVNYIFKNTFKFRGEKIWYSSKQVNESMNYRRKKS